MAKKADFTEQEWDAMQKGVTGAGMLVSVADRGFFDTFKEAGAMAKHLQSARENSQSELVRELSEARGTGFGLTASPDEVEKETVEALKTSMTTLQAKAPDEVDAYRASVLAVAESVAKAAKDVGAEESGAIEKIKGAMDSSRQHARGLRPQARSRPLTPEEHHRDNQDPRQPGEDAEEGDGRERGDAEEDAEPAGPGTGPFRGAARRGTLRSPSVLRRRRRRRAPPNRCRRSRGRSRPARAPARFPRPCPPASRVQIVIARKKSTAKSVPPTSVSTASVSAPARRSRR